MNDERLTYVGGPLDGQSTEFVGESCAVPGHHGRYVLDNWHDRRELIPPDTAGGEYRWEPIKAYMWEST